MERLEGPINPLWLGEELSSEPLHPWGIDACGLMSGGQRQMPFLQLLQGTMGAGEKQMEDQGALFATYPPESHFELLLRLQDVHSTRAAAASVEQLESCITHSSESQPESRAANAVNPHHQQREGLSPAAAAAAPEASRKERRRKRPRPAPAPAKKPEETESQRMTHIAVERNRRRLINDHLATLRSLVPSSFVPRGDQASIVGGAIDYVKELEQLLLSLQAEKRRRPAAAASALLMPAAIDGFFTSPQYTSYSRCLGGAYVKEEAADEQEEALDYLAAAAAVDVEATVVQGHVSLKVAGQRRPGQLARAVAAIEELRLSVLHLCVTSLDGASNLYSFNLKMEEGCKLGSADEIAAAVHQIFGFSGACC